MRTIALVSLALVCALPAAAAPQETDAPRLYLVASSALEAHHGARAGSSGYGYLLHAGADFGSFSIEGVTEGPLAKEQSHVRRALGADVLFHPLAFNYVQPYLAAGAGYYFPAAGRDAYATWAADFGGGVRLGVGDPFWLQFGVRCMVPVDPQTGVATWRDRFQVLEIGIGARF